MQKNKTKQTIDSYNKCASSFENKFINYGPYKRIITEFHKKYLKDKRSILDVGCGPGNNAKILSELNPDYKITGIDLSDKMLELARINAPECIFKRIDIRNLETNIKYDAIIASFCIVHLSLQETKQLISKARSILNNYGVFYISFMEGKANGFEKTSFSSSNKIYFNYHTKEQIKYLLKSNKLNILEIIEKQYNENDGTSTNEIFIFSKKF